MTNLRQLAERATERGQLLTLLRRAMSRDGSTDAEWVEAILAAGFRATAATEGDIEAAWKLWETLLTQHKLHGGISREVTETIAAALASAKAPLQEKIGALFGAIAHGDDEHRAWLQKAIEDHFAGRVVERSRGLNTADAIAQAKAPLQEKIANLERQLAEIESWYRSADAERIATKSSVAEARRDVDALRKAISEEIARLEDTRDHGGLTEYGRGALDEAKRIQRAALAGGAEQRAWPKMCVECGKYPADPPSKLCPGCEAYKEHQK